jgi:ComF family protein
MKWISDLINIIFPRSCAVCGKALSPGEKDICVNCLLELPRMDEYTPCNETEKLFYGILEIERAAAYMHHTKGSPYNNLIYNIKYNDRPEIATRMAATAATELIKKGFFEGIDVIIPIPLSKKKRRLRGYNQCDYIARGLSDVTGIPIDTSSVIRHIANETQTHKQREARWKNVESVFSVTSPESLKGKHILLVDDVVTTGATLSSCGKSILAATPDARLSIFALSSAGRTI